MFAHTVHVPLYACTRTLTPTLACLHWLAARCKAGQGGAAQRIAGLGVTCLLCPTSCEAVRKADNYFALLGPCLTQPDCLIARSPDCLAACLSGGLPSWMAVRWSHGRLAGSEAKLPAACRTSWALPRRWSRSQLSGLAGWHSEKFHLLARRFGSQWTRRWTSGCPFKDHSASLPGDRLVATGGHAAHEVRHPSCRVASQGRQRPRQGARQPGSEPR